MLESFYFIVAAWNTYITKTKTQSKSDPKTKTKELYLHYRIYNSLQRLYYKYFPINFEKIVNAVLTPTASEIMSKKELVI